MPLLESTRANKKPTDSKPPRGWFTISLMVPSAAVNISGGIKSRKKLDDVLVKILAADVGNESEQKDNGRKNGQRKVIGHVRRPFRDRIELHFVDKHHEHVVNRSLPVIEPQFLQKNDELAVRPAVLYVFIVKPHLQNKAPLFPEFLPALALAARFSCLQKPWWFRQ